MLPGHDCSDKGRYAPVIAVTRRRHGVPTNDEIIDALSEPGSFGFQETVDLAIQEPDRLPDLIELAAQRLPRSSNAIDAVFALLPDDELARIADASVAALRPDVDRGDSQAASLIALLSLQAPKTLRGHLRTLWNLAPNARAYYGEWPWRGAGSGPEIDRLRVHLAEEDPEAMLRAWTCLLESRTPDGWEAAIDAIGSIPRDETWAGERFLAVGSELRTDGVRSLVSEPPHHVLFPKGFLRPFRWVNTDGPVEDPTWAATGEVAGRGRFGGSIRQLCKVCGRPLCRLLALDECPSSFLGPAEFVTCLSCLVWSEGILYFAHGGGAISPAGPEVTPREPEWPADAFPEVPVNFVRSAPRWRYQDWALSNSRENLNRLGGEPTWIQNPQFPSCPECGERMPFTMQLDSLEIEGTPGWLWGSGGILYAFWCSRDSISATFCQWT
jgi:hypothetical protein